MVFKRRHNWSLLTALLLAVIFIYSCSPDEFGFNPTPSPGRTEEQPSVRIPVKNYRNVLILYLMGYNNLVYFLQTNINDLLANPISKDPRDVVLIFSHMSNGYNYSTPTSPTLTKITQDFDGNVLRDTLMVLPKTQIATSPEVLNEVLTYVHANFESERYGMLMSSHGSGWVPAQYFLKGENIGNRYDTQQENRMAMMSNDMSSSGIYRERRHLLKSIGAHYPASNSIEIDITDLAQSIPFKLDYLIFDACLMGGIEVAYELRNVTDKMIASQTEILADGMHYPSLCSLLFSQDSPDLVGVSRKFYELYERQSGDYKSCTISLVDCTKLENLAQVTRNIIDQYRSNLAVVQDNRDNIQKYFCAPYTSTQKWFYDFEDIITNCNLSEADSITFESALKDVILYKAATPRFLTSLRINHHSGLSMYLPFNTDRDNLNKFYKTLEWNKATGLIE